MPNPSEKPKKMLLEDPVQSTDCNRGLNTFHYHNQGYLGHTTKFYHRCTAMVFIWAFRLFKEADRPQRHTGTAFL